MERSRPQAPKLGVGNPGHGLRHPKNKTDGRPDRLVQARASSLPPHGVGGRYHPVDDQSGFHHPRRRRDDDNVDQGCGKLLCSVRGLEHRLCLRHDGSVGGVPHQGSREPGAKQNKVWTNATLAPRFGVMEFLERSRTERSRLAQARPQTALCLSAGFILLALLGLSLVAWLLTVRQMSDASMVPSLIRFWGSRSVEMPRDMSMEQLSPLAMAAPVFVAMWTTMMAAMMFPSVSPMVIAYWKISRRRAQSVLAVPVFVGAYIGVWAISGLGAYFAYRAVLTVVQPMSTRTLGLVGGGVLAAAGAYQLSKLKTVCLRHCRNPMHFLFHFRAGVGGAGRMGVEHGMFCFGCCWGLMVALFAVGLTNLALMGMVSAVIFIEKIAPFGRRAAKGFGIALMIFGALVAMLAVV